MLMMIRMTVFAGKAAVLLLYYRVFSPSRSFRWKIYAILVVAFVSNVVSIPLNAALCSPPRGKSWAVHDPKCDESFNYGLVVGIINVMIDLMAFCLPIPMVLSLQLPLKRKIGVLAIFATGSM